MIHNEEKTSPQWMLFRPGTLRCNAFVVWFSCYLGIKNQLLDFLISLKFSNILCMIQFPINLLENFEFSCFFPFYTIFSKYWQNHFLLEGQQQVCHQWNVLVKKCTNDSQENFDWKVDGIKESSSSSVVLSTSSSRNIYENIEVTISFFSK